MRKLVLQVLTGAGFALLVSCGIGEKGDAPAQNLPSIDQVHAEVHAEYDDNKKLVIELLDAVWHKNNLDALGDYHAEDIINHNAPSGMNKGIEAYKKFCGMYAASFSGHRFYVEDQIAEGDEVATRLSYTGKHTGDFMGIPASGKTVSIEGIRIDKIKDGKIVEHWAIFDKTELMQQLRVNDSTAVVPEN